MLEMHDNRITDNESKQSTHTEQTNNRKQQKKYDKHRSECEKSTLSAKWVQIHMTWPFGRFYCDEFVVTFLSFLLLFFDKLILKSLYRNTEDPFPYIFRVYLALSYIISACNANFVQATQPRSIEHTKATREPLNCSFQHNALSEPIRDTQIVRE